MAFHLGVLKRLAEKEQLEEVRKISTVSGGSLVTGLIYLEADLRWPTSDRFLSRVYPALRKKLCVKSLQWGAARQLVNPMNWRFILSRANLLALALKKEWGIGQMVADLPTDPEWSINGTTAENGKRFRFKAKNMGDYSLGYADTKDVPLADAMAMSAAFPVGFGPLAMDTTSFDLRKRPSWDSRPEEAATTPCPFRKIHLYDGGIYDNLGLEPFYDIGKSEPKDPEMRIILSDAGAPLAPTFSQNPLSPFRMKRIADIATDQTRALRVRNFMEYLKADERRGSYYWIGEIPEPVDRRKDAEFVRSYPTTLRKLSEDSFDRIAGYGYSIAQDSE
jgi:NTE family protein